MSSRTSYREAYTTATLVSQPSVITLSSARWTRILSTRKFPIDVGQWCPQHQLVTRLWWGKWWGKWCECANFCWTLCISVATHTIFEWSRSCKRYEPFPCKRYELLEHQTRGLLTRHPNQTFWAVFFHMVMAGCRKLLIDYLNAHEAHTVNARCTAASIIIALWRSMRWRAAALCKLRFVTHRRGPLLAYVWK